MAPYRMDAPTMEGLSNPARRTDRRIVTFPDYSRANPYTEMLYSRLLAKGIPCSYLDLRTEAGLRALPRLAPGTILHMQWEHAVLDGASDPAAARASAARFEAALHDFGRRGGRTIWTVHNQRPHEERFPDAVDALMGVLAARADRVHVMCDHTVGVVPGLADRTPETIATIPHGSYSGWYPPPVSGPVARARLGLPDDVLVLACLGIIRPYKGIDRMLAHLDAIEHAAGRAVKFLVAGEVMEWAGSADLVGRLEADARVHFIRGFVPSSDLPYMYGSADIAVLPYRRILNSGALLAALSYGVPVVAPMEGCVPSVVDGECSILFTPNDDRSLLAALRDAVGPDGLLSPSAREAALRRAHAWSYADMSNAFSDLADGLWAEAPSRGLRARWPFARAIPRQARS